MNRVQIRPMGAATRQIPLRLRPTIPSIFPNAPPTAEDIALARELFCALDAESQAWYRRSGSRLFDDL